MMSPDQPRAKQSDVFSLWERGRISNQQFKDGLRGCGAPLTAELDRLLIAANPTSLRQAICDFVDGHIPAVTFRSQLQRFGVALTPDLDKMIRTHEGDSSVRFQDFARLMLRQDRPATPRSVSSGYRSATPRSEAMFAPRSPASSSAPFATGQWDVQSQASQATESSRRRQVEPPYATGEAKDEGNRTRHMPVTTFFAESR
ncbi:unnamed protein product [Effrenium voratum]|nr:unnamed protein product [Effrenium voratum]